MKEVYLKDISDEICVHIQELTILSEMPRLNNELSELIMADLRDALHNFTCFEIERTRSSEYKSYNVLVAEYNVCDQYDDCVVMYADNLAALIEDSISYFFKKNGMENPVANMSQQTVHEGIVDILMDSLSGCEHGVDYIIPLEILKDNLSFDEHGFAAEDFIQKVQNDCNLNEFGTSMAERNIAVVERNANSIDQIAYDLSDMMGIVSPEMVAAFCHDSILSKGMQEVKQIYWDNQTSNKSTTVKKTAEDREH